MMRTKAGPWAGMTAPIPADDEAGAVRQADDIGDVRNSATIKCILQEIT